MSDAKTLLKEFLSNFGNPEKAAALFAEDGVFDAPSSCRWACPPRCKGPVGVKGVLTTVVDYYPDFEFKYEEHHPPHRHPRPGVRRIRH
jgi:uncharacterized protein